MAISLYFSFTPSQLNILPHTYPLSTVNYFIISFQFPINIVYLFTRYLYLQCSPFTHSLTHPLPLRRIIFTWNQLPYSLICVVFSLNNKSYCYILYAVTLTSFTVTNHALTANHYTVWRQCLLAFVTASSLPRMPIRSKHFKC